MYATPSTAPAVERELPSDEAHALLELTRDLVRAELQPCADDAEEAREFPRHVFALLGETGLLTLPFAEEFGGGGQPATVYLQVVEELARGWLAVGMGVSVHVLSCHGVAAFGTRQQQEAFLPDMLDGRRLGAFCLSESHAGSDVAAMRTRAVRSDAGWTISGEKAWITHGGVADHYLVMARTAAPGVGGSHTISAFHVPADAGGIRSDPPEKKMGLRSSITTGIRFADTTVPESHLLGEEGDGLRIALSALDAGRLGIAACAVGVAQAALDVAVRYSRERQAFGRDIADFQGVGFLLADAAAGIEAARQLYLYAARRRDAGLRYSTQAAMAKLTATDTAMRVTTDMVQVLGGAGYVQDHPVERYMREAKVLQILEGTNQIQRLVISRSLTALAKQQ